MPVWATFFSLALLLVAKSVGSGSPTPVDATAAQITILYDAFGPSSAMRKDWGYSAFIEFSGKRILFDTGNNPDNLEQNAKAKRLDLSKLDFVVMSHRHGDHMGGLAYVLRVNPRVKIYAPKESFGVYGSDLPGTFYRKEPSLSPDERYFGGTSPDMMRFGSAWPGANFQLIDKATEIAPDFHLITLVSDKPGTLELRELSLALNTPDGMVILVGCSHPGIEKIVEAATAVNPRIHLIAGGFHLVVASDPDIEKVIIALHDTFKVEYVAPGHCTGEPAFAALRKAFGDRYLYAGLGSTIAAAPGRIDRSLQAEPLAHQPLQPWFVKQIEGQFFIGEHRERGSFRASREFRRFFHCEVGILTDDRHDHADHRLQAADFTSFFLQFAARLLVA